MELYHIRYVKVKETDSVPVVGLNTIIVMVDFTTTEGDLKFKRL